MAKIALIILSVILALYANPATYNILKLPAGAKIQLDSDILKWPQAYFVDSIRSDYNVFARDDTVLTWTPALIQYYLYAAHDDSNVYFAAKVVADNMIRVGGTYGSDCMKINPGGQAAGFYLWSNNTILINPSSPFRDGSALNAICDSLGNGPFATYEFSLAKSIVDASGTQNFTYSIGMEDNDRIYLAVGVEYMGNKRFNSQWDNPLYYPTYHLDSTLGPVLNRSISTIQIPTIIFNRKPLFLWHPLTGASDYTIQIDTTSNFLVPLISSNIVADTFYRPSIDLPFGKIFWRVNGGQPVVTSNIRSFMLQDSSLQVILIPFAPSLTQEKRPTLMWHRISGATAYNIQIAHVLSFTNPDVNVTVLDTFFKPVADISPGRIYWRVNSSLNSKYSPWSSFYIQADTIPFLYGFMGADIADYRPLFRWKPVARATSYRIQLDTSKYFPAAVPIDVADTTFRPLADLGNRKYYWHVSCNLNYTVYSPSDSLNIVPTAMEGKIGLTGPRAFLAMSPNPFNSFVKITFANTNGNATIEIINIAGRKVAQISRLSKNYVIWDAKSEPNGAYFVKLTSGKNVVTRKICLMK